MKYCIDKYPVGTIPNQRKPGRYMDDALHENIKILAKNIKKDLTYLGIIFSSTYEVGTGKSTLAQQIGEAYQEMVYQLHKVKNEFTIDNIVFTPEDLIKRAFKIPKFSAIVLDEWEDAHYWSKLGITLRDFFRKCRQLNLFIIIIIPNFFQLPKNYAISRSLFAIDVRFEGEFERGFFRFYNFERKKKLYLYGKKNEDYSVVKSNFFGRFLKGYAVNEKEYLDKKKKDLLRQEKKKEIKVRTINAKALFNFHRSYPDIPLKEVGEKVFRISERTSQRWIKVIENENNLERDEIEDMLEEAEKEGDKEKTEI